MRKRIGRHVLRYAILCVGITLAPLASRAADVQDLLRAYPDQLTSVAGDTLIWRDGTRIPLGSEESVAPESTLLHAGSIRDMLREPYPTGPQDAPPESDPGRIRNRAFFDKMYGDCRRGEVTPHLTPIVWLPHTWGHTVGATNVNDIAARLTAISAEIDVLPEQIKRFAYPLGGIYNCRPVADTGEPSMHSEGAAIDINVRLSDYWLWRRGAAYENRIPYDIVSIFERHGFIWGGKWAHYDTMHFEYRPELLGIDPRAAE